ncbi:MAG: PRC-barrel domain-containing protein [Thermoanaerobaculia bacterium]
MKHNERHERLALLRELRKVRVAKGEPDIRDWDVVTADRRRIGKVHELVVDTVEMKVRYLDVEVEGKILDLRGDTHVLIPIAGAHLDNDDNRVYLDDVTVEELRALPPYDHRRITSEFEANIATWFRSARGRQIEPVLPRTEPVGEPAREELFSDRRFWGERRKGRENADYLASNEDRDRAR